MRRREFIALGGGAAVVLPRAAQAQLPEQGRRIGVLFPGAEGDPYYSPRTTALREVLKELGWVEGRNVRFEYRWTQADPDRNQAYAVELVGLAPDVILAAGTPPVRALRQSTSTIPIVFLSVSDPVGDGFVASLAKPGGNSTGFSNYDPSMVGKWLQLLKEIAPNTKRIAVIFNPDTAPHAIFLPSIVAAAPSLGVDAVPVQVRNGPEIENSIAALGREQTVGLLAIPDAFTVNQRDLLTTLTARHRLPAIYPFPAFCGLISYGVDNVDQYRRAASFIDRILKGARPGDLPVQQPTKFELVINLKTAKALGIAISPALLARADEMIE
jgi:putative ABC transport system substrate-binding protein